VSQATEGAAQFNVDCPHAKKLCRIGDIVGRFDNELRWDEPIDGGDAMEALGEIFDVLNPGER
jgi:hypothetical protein